MSLYYRFFIAVRGIIADRLAGQWYSTSDVREWHSGGLNPIGEAKASDRQSDQHYRNLLIFLPHIFFSAILWHMLLATQATVCGFISSLY